MKRIYIYLFSLFSFWNVNRELFWMWIVNCELKIGDWLNWLRIWIRIVGYGLNRLPIIIVPNANMNMVTIRLSFEIGYEFKWNDWYHPNTIWMTIWTTFISVMEWPHNNFLIPIQSKWNNTGINSNLNFKMVKKRFCFLNYSNFVRIFPKISSFRFRFHFFNQTP